MSGIAHLVSRAAQSRSELRAVLRDLAMCRYALRSLGLPRAGQETVRDLIQEMGASGGGIDEVLQVAGPAGVVELASIEALEAYLQSADSFGLLKESDELEIVYTAGDAWSHLVPPKARDTWGALKDLARGARKSLILAAPFMTTSGIEHLRRDIEGAISRGVEVTLVTTSSEELSTPQVPRQARLVVHDSERQWFHAKLAGRDGGEVAYAGSANTTGKGLNEGFEFGFLISGPVARRIWEVLKGLASPLVDRNQGYE